MSKIKLFGIGFLVFATLYVVFDLAFASRSGGCVLSGFRLTISTITYGPFSEFIPQTGMVHRDTIKNIITVKVPVDEIYFSRIVTGLEATTTFKNIDYQLQVTKVNPEVIGGRFTVEMNFTGDTLPDITSGQSLRLRLRLSPTQDAVLLPVGGFYKDTGGKWVFLVEEGDKVVKRYIKLGRKNTENYEVLERLKPGDHVITSTYDGFDNKESFDLKEMKDGDE